MSTQGLWGTGEPLGEWRNRTGKKMEVTEDATVYPQLLSAESQTCGLGRPCISRPLRSQAAISSAVCNSPASDPEHTAGRAANSLP